MPHHGEDPGMDLQAVSDKLEIQELLARDARGVDSQDWELWKSVFTDDASSTTARPGPPVGPARRGRGLPRQGLGHGAVGQHHITNIEIDLDGDRAKVRAMFYNPMQIPGVAGPSLLRRLLPPRLVRTRRGGRARTSSRRTSGWSDGPRRDERCRRELTGGRARRARTVTAAVSTPTPPRPRRPGPGPWRSRSTRRTGARARPSRPW